MAHGQHGSRGLRPWRHAADPTLPCPAPIRRSHGLRGCHGLRRSRGVCGPRRLPGSHGLRRPNGRRETKRMDCAASTPGRRRPHGLRHGVLRHNLAQIGQCFGQHSDQIGSSSGNASANAWRNTSPRIWFQGQQLERNWATLGQHRSSLGFPGVTFRMSVMRTVSMELPMVSADKAIGSPEPAMVSSGSHNEQNRPWDRRSRL